MALLLGADLGIICLVGGYVMLLLLLVFDACASVVYVDTVGLVAAGCASSTWVVVSAGLVLRLGCLGFDCMFGLRVDCFACVDLLVICLVRLVCLDLIWVRL